MKKTYSIGRFFITVASQAGGAPIVDRGFTNEKEGARRRGRCFVIRPPFTKHRPVKALVIGRWIASKSDSADRQMGAAADRTQTQFAAISTAAVGYWREGDLLHPDFDSVALRDVARLYSKYEMYRKAMRAAMDELGVPQPGYPQPVVNAYDHLHRVYYAGIECVLGEDDYKPVAAKG